jgi:hypothetical protein
MTMYAALFARDSHCLSEAPEDPGRQSRFSVDLTEFLRPECFWPSPYTIEQAFETFRKMVATGKGYATPDRWGHTGVYGLLSASSAYDDSHVDPIRSLDDLRERFHYALLGRNRSPAIAQWRKDHRMMPGQRIQVRVPIHKPFEGARYLGYGSESDIKTTLTAMFTQVRGKRLHASLNSVHLGVRGAQRVTIAVSPSGFRFVLDFGTFDERGNDGSRWGETLARTRPGETFLETMTRVRDVLHVLLTGEVHPCDAADFMDGQQYTPAWYQAYITGYMAGSREPCRPPQECIDRGFVSLHEHDAEDAA